MVLTFGVILTHNRHELLRQCVDALSPQVHILYVIDNASDPPVDPSPDDYIIEYVSQQPPNLASLWNHGLNEIEQFCERESIYEWNVVLVCDDAAIPAGWVDTVSGEMRRWNATAGSTHSYVEIETSIRKIDHDSDLHNRMCGWAFMLNGESGIRADERFHWWWCDTDLDWQARTRGGMVISRGPVVHNIHPNDFTYSVPGLSERAGQDGLEFAAKWGWRPW